jgi:hypothetical protein
MPPSAPPADLPPEGPLTAPAQAYEPPAIVWEEPFVALAQTSPPPCIPGSDPRCTP